MSKKHKFGVSNKLEMLDKTIVAGFIRRWNHESDWDNFSEALIEELSQEICDKFGSPARGKDNYAKTK
jgi:hypothetical protein